MNVPVRFQQTIDIIELKYDIKREYFTVMIPVIVAVLLVLAAFMTGHTLSLFSSSNDQQQSLEKMQETAIHNLLLKQIGGSEGEGTSTTTETPAPAQTSDLDHYLFYGAIIAMTPYSIDRFLQRREKKRNEEDFTQFLFKMSELMRAGIDPIKSVIELSRTELGSLSKHISLAASTMVIGGSFEDGMRRVSKSLKSVLITKYIDLIVQASNTGGSVHNLILKASEDMRAMIMIDREMEGNLQQYVLIFYFAQVILIVMAYILSTQLFPFMTGSNMKQILGGGGISDINYQQGFFHMLMLNALIGGIIIGKISEGSAKDGLKHSVVLMCVTYVACVLIILPVPSVQQISIVIVSGDQQTGITGMPLDKSLMLHVQDSAGKPLAKTTVELSITPTDGIIKPSYGVTDAKGNLTAQVVLGQESGIYIIKATIGNMVTIATAYGNKQGTSNEFVT